MASIIQMYNLVKNFSGNVAINDVSMFRVAGVSIAFNSSCDELKSIATEVVESNDLLDVLSILKKMI